MFRRDYNDLVGIKNSVCGYFCKQSFTVVIKLGFDPVISRGSEDKVFLPRYRLSY